MEGREVGRASSPRKEWAGLWWKNTAAKKGTGNAVLRDFWGKKEKQARTSVASWKEKEKKSTRALKGSRKEKK